MADGEREFLKHFLAALAYRTRKATLDAPQGFGSFQAGSGLRSPHELLQHMSHVLWYSLSVFDDCELRIEPSDSLEAEVVRFHGLLEELRDQLDGGAPFDKADPRRLLQGPLSDAMTHAGQLAMLRRLAGSPIPPENFYAASISATNLSPDQPPANEA